MAWSPQSTATSGDDEYIGTSANDGRSGAPIRGLDGNDRLSGLAGNDTLSGDAGDDFLFGGTGNDVLDGGDGNDHITDEDGNDRIFGGAGDDTIIHRETTGGLNSSVFIAAGSGNDAVRVDWRYFGDFDWNIDGGTGIDSLELADFDNARTKNMTYLDQTGFEILYLGSAPVEVAADQLEAFDTIRYSATNTTSLISLLLYRTGDLDLADELGSQPVLIRDKTSGNRMIRTGSGNDAIFGGTGSDIIYGGGGHDKISGNGPGIDTLYGEDGDDDLAAVFGSTLHGGAGNDTLKGGSFQYGEGGDDILWAASSPGGAIYDGGENFDTLLLSQTDTDYDLDLRGTTLRLIEKLSFGSAARSADVAVARIFAGQIGAGIWSEATLQGYNDSTLIITMGNYNATDLSGFKAGGGSPKIRIDGDADAETITGSLFADTIFGNGGADVLAGGKGVDAIYGGAGDDILYGEGSDGSTANEVYDGGEGFNTLVASGPIYRVDFSDDTLANIDVLKFTNPGPLSTGTIKVSANQIADIFQINGQGAASTGDVLEISMGTRTILYLTAQFGYVFTAFTGASDYIVITGDNDAETILATQYKDVLYGNGGDDYLDPGAGFDRVFGGGGNDFIMLNTGDVVAGETHDGGTGFDTLTIASPSSASYDLDLGRNIVTSIEQVFFGGVAGSGGLGVIRFLASQVGAGLSATATIYGSNVDCTDVLAFTMGTAARLDLSGMTIDFGAGRGDYVSITGDDDAETITGSNAIDAISAGGGNDVIDGAGGADVLAGGLGNDLYLIDPADTVIEHAGEGTDTITAAVTYTLGANLENLTLSGTGAIDGTGNALANVLTGNAGTNVLRGLSGNDTYVVGTGDQVVENAGEGIDFVRASIDWALGDNLENLVLLGVQNASGTGNALANRLTGNSGDNALTGLDGNDTLLGMDGADTLGGGLGRDRLTGGAGNDRFVFDTAPRAINVDVITDFTPGQDMLHLARSIFTTIGAVLNPGELRIGTTAANTVALDANDFLLYNRTTGQLFYDSDGNGAIAATPIATLSTHPLLSVADFLMT